MAYSVPDLPYAYDALEPHIDEATMRVHHDKHHQAYVDKVNAALDEVMKGRTTFVIAHRLSTIRNATRILVFENGRVSESGTFDELVAKGGHFAGLAKAQFMVQEQDRTQDQGAVATPEVVMELPK